MKTDIPRQGAIYRGGKEKPGRRLKAYLPLLLAALLVAHFLNVFLQWSVIRGELEQKSSFRSPEYTFLGFAPFHGQEIEAARRLPNAAPRGRVYAFFDLLHPAVFLIWNNSHAEDFFDLGPIVAAAPPGASHVTFFPGSVFLLRREGGAVARNFGGSIVGNAWSRALNEKNPDGVKKSGFLSGSFVAKPETDSPSRKVPYLVYFYLPLALIAVAIAWAGPAMAAAFFYYAGMFFLADFQRLFVSVPLAWLFAALGLELPVAWVRALATALAVVFLAAAVYGLWRWKDREMPPGARWIVWFFILLPLFLFL